MTARLHRLIPLLLLVVLFTGCTARPSPGPAAVAAPRVAWQFLFDSGSADLFYAAPDGSGYLFLEHTGGLIHVAASDGAVQAVPTTSRSFLIGSETVEVRLAETPYGRMLITTEERGQVSLSPDRRRLAIAKNGLWVADLGSGSLTRVSSEPQPPTVPQLKHQVWDWAMYPSWSADGRWLEFYATREKPGQLALWRVPAAGGPEELVSGQNTGPFGVATLPDGRVVRIEPDAFVVYPAAVGDPVRLDPGLTGPYILSPDGRWGLILDREQPALHVVDVAAGSSRVVPLPVGAGPLWAERWHGNQVVLLTRAVEYNGPAFLSVLDLPTGQLTHFTAPDPTRGEMWPLGWDARGRIVVRVLPLMDWYYPDPAQARTAPQGVWLLDPAAWQPPTPAIPSALRYAGLAGPGTRWEQFAGNDPVKGGEVTAVPQSVLLLRFDQPLSEGWIRQGVQVEGPGAVAVHGAPLGLAIVRLDGAKPGETVRVQVPAFGFDLRVEIVASAKD